MNTEISDSTEGSGLYQTVPLTEQLESGQITPGEYVRLRWKLIGRTTVLETVLSPLLDPIVLFVRGIRNHFAGERYVRR